MTTELHCDFCYAADPDPITRYEVEDFDVYACNPETMKVVKALASYTDWLACSECAALIGADNWSALEDRFLAEDPEAAKLTAVEKLSLRLNVRALWAGFRKHRIPVER